VGRAGKLADEKPKTPCAGMDIFVDGLGISKFTVYFSTF